MEIARLRIGFACKLCVNPNNQGLDIKSRSALFSCGYRNIEIWFSTILDLGGVLGVRRVLDVEGVASIH